MRERRRNFYKIGREAAGLTQEAAAEALNISVRSLAAYENNEVMPKDDIVENMVKLYKTKILGLQHLRNTSRLARECLPEVIPPESNADVYLQAVISEDDIAVVTKVLKELLADGKITEDELEAYEKVRLTAKSAAGRLMSISNFEPEVSEVGE